MEQQCILCNANAEFLEVDKGNAKHFKCSGCSDYQITIAAERKLEGATRKWLAELSAMARSADHDSLLVIFVPNLNVTSGHAYESVGAELLTRNEAYS